MSLEVAVSTTLVLLSIYFITHHTIFLVVLVRAAALVLHSRRWQSTSVLGAVFANPLTPGVTVIIPAHNESAGIVQCVQSVLNLRYPLVQTIVIDDGSTDDTFDKLSMFFDLSPSEHPERHELPQPTQPSTTYASERHRLLVLRKPSTGRRADAVNAGLRHSEHELVCIIDGDSLLERDALLHVIQPFIEDELVVAAGGVVRPANGTTSTNGNITSIAMPRRLVERIQVLEYLRAFLVGRAGWSAINGLLIISGAFGVFRTQAVLAAGGLDARSLAEDADLVVSIHKYYRTRKIPYRIAFIPEPVCWTEVPDTLTVLSRQRKRWSQGLGDLLRKHRSMIGNPRYRSIGLITLPYFTLFEYLGPVVGLAAVILAVITTLCGLTSPLLMLVIIAVSYGLAVLTSLTALVIEEYAFTKYTGRKNTLALVQAAFLEPLWFYTIHAYWRLIGVIRAARKQEVEWGTMPRTGFSTESTVRTHRQSPSLPG